MTFQSKSKLIVDRKIEGGRADSHGKGKINISLLYSNIFWGEDK